MTTTTENQSLRVPLDTASSGGQDSNSAHLRPPADHLPDSLRGALADFDAFSADLDRAQTHERYLAEPYRDHEAESADIEANAAARRAGKAPKNPTAHRDKLAADRRAAADEIGVLRQVLSNVSGELASLRNVEASDPVWRAHIDDTRQAARDSLTQVVALVDALVQVEAVDAWLSGVGPKYAPSSAVFVTDLVPGLATRGVARDTAGAVELTALIATLRDVVL